jgi:hypothetical protein
MEAAKIIIVGGGVAGLVAARELEAAGHRPTLIEASDRPGGRVKTDKVGGYALDHGFQVLLSAYQEAQRYLDYEALDLGHFRPGAIILDGQRRRQVVDPLREPSQLLAALFSGVGTLKDKWLVWRLTQLLKGQPNEALFNADGGQMSSRAFLQQFGFSEGMIRSFFQPFFGGIFLENELATPAPLLQFVFKHFANGYASLPAGGIEAIPRQLAAALARTTIRTNTKATGLDGSQLLLEGNDPLPFDALIVATDPRHLLPRLAGPALGYRETTTLYFETEQSPLQGQRLIALADREEGMVNNFCEVNSVGRDYAPAGKTLLSVTLKDIPTRANAEEAVAGELRALLRQPDLMLRPLARYDIPRALPALEQLTYTYQPSQARLTEQVFLAGDHLTFGSLDAAMRSGRLAAQGVLEAMQVV